MKKLNLYLITPVIILTVMYSLGYIKNKVSNPLLWGDDTCKFLLALTCLIYLGILIQEGAIKADYKVSFTIIWLVSFFNTGIWALIMLVLYCLFTHRM